MVEKLKIRSLNVNGIQCQKKRDLVFNELTKYSNDIILLQETHSSALDERNYKNKWGTNTYFSHGTTSSRGVCIIIPKTFKGNSELIFADLEGRILIVKITLEGEDYIICNIYCPISSAETEQINVLIKLSGEIIEYLNNNLILCGDWNVIMDNLLDKKSDSKVLCTNTKYRDILKIFLEEFELVDCWRMVHPNTRKYTCRSGKKGKRVTQSRIDMIFIKENLLNILLNTTIEAGFMSDHNFTTITLKTSNNVRGKGAWKFNNNMLKDKIYVNMVKTLIAKEIDDNKHYEDKGFLWDYLKMRIRSETMIYCGKIQKAKRDHMTRLTEELEKLDTKYMDDPQMTIFNN
jgi:exonuclease III